VPGKLNTKLWHGGDVSMQLSCRNTSHETTTPGMARINGTARPRPAPAHLLGSPAIPVDFSAALTDRASARIQRAGRLRPLHSKNKKKRRVGGRWPDPRARSPENPSRRNAIPRQRDRPLERLWSAINSFAGYPFRINQTKSTIYPRIKPTRMDVSVSPVLMQLATLPG
jgi:hypothetical protein